LWEVYLDEYCGTAGCSDIGGVFPSWEKSGSDVAR